jgi:hypothetical protein
MEPTNVLFLMSDEHIREVIGCYGNSNAHTPHLDRLAASGTRFDNAYTPSPICVSARASLATGRWVHDIGAWSSAEPYTGSPPGWGHGLIEAGHGGIASDCEAALRAILDPDAVNRLAFSDQARRIEALGGREAILQMSGQEFGFTPLRDDLDPSQPR